MTNDFEQELLHLEPGETPKLEWQLCFALYSASRATIDIYRPLLEEAGITYPQYLVLLILWEYGTSSVKEIGARLHLDSGTLSPLLKRLEAANFIKRQRRLEDERVVDISLAERGLALKSQAASIAQQFACGLGLTLDEYLNLMVSLKKLIAHLYEQEDPRQS